MYKSILIFAAHADDEMVMAGTIAAHAEAGSEITVVQSTNGSEGYLRPEDRDNIVKIRKKEADACDRVLGISERIHLGYDDMSGTYDKESFKKCIKIIREKKPEAVFTHGPSSLNRDHIALYKTTREAVWQAGEPVTGELGAPHKPGAVYFYKDYADRGPCVVFDISRHIKTKLKAYEAYGTQLEILGERYEAAKAWNSLPEAERPHCLERFEAAYFHNFNEFI